MAIQFHVTIAAMLMLPLFVAHAQAEDEHADRIHQVENGLSHPTRIAGDETWAIQDRMEHYGVPGMCVAVIRNNQVIWTKAYGVTDRESGASVTTDTLFQCASISKPLSAAATLCLSADGLFDLDTDINEYLESWKLPDNEFSQKQKVTARHLISHTAGTTVHGFGGYAPGVAVPTLPQLLDGTAPSNSPAIRLDKAPGESFRYSGGGYCALQQMLIDVTGKTFPEIMRETILGPLAMSRSTYEQPLPADKLKFAANGYKPDATPVEGGCCVHPEMAAAGLWSTADDLAKFFIEVQLALKGEGRTQLTEELAEDMLTPFVGKRNGLGIFLIQHDDDIYFQHGGWNEGFSSAATAHRDKGYGVVVLTNSNHPPFIDEVIASVARVYKWHSFTTPEYQPQELSDVQIEQVVGRYNRGGGLVRVFVKGSEIYFQPFGAEATRIIPIGDMKFVTPSDDVLIRFVEDDSSGKQQLVLESPWNDDDEEQRRAMTKLAGDEQLPAGWLLDGDFETALEAYLDRQKSDADHPSIQEEALNEQGYALLANEELDLAIELFRINTKLHPQAFNTFDSLGEAYLKRGDKQLAIENYRRSLELNPENAGARAVLEEIDSQTR